MTRRSLEILALALAVSLFAHGSLRAEPVKPAPDFKEVLQLLHDNLPGATDESLNRASVEGLLAQFPGKVSLASASGEPAADGCKSSILESNIAYLRLSNVSGNFADALGAAYRSLAATNTLAGVVLDLRFANGDGFTAAAASAKAIKSDFRPLTVLINGETRGAAETLAGALRAAKAGLLIGGETAGEAATFKELPLSNGQRLRIATATGKSTSMPANRVTPDIAVTVNAEDESAYFADAYASLAHGETNSVPNTNRFSSFIDHTSEADLVRAKIKDGEQGENGLPPRPVEPAKPYIHDPALARAVDLIKGLAALRPARS